MAASIKRKKTAITNYLRHYIPKGGNPGDHKIICPRCLSHWWVDPQLLNGGDPQCANCDYVDLTDHSTCLDGNCCNAI